MALDVAMIMRLVDRFTAPARKMEASVDRITQKTGRLGRAGQSFDRIAAGARRAGVAVNGVYLKAMEKAGHATGRLIRNTASLGLEWAKWGLAGGVAAAGWAGVNMIKTAADFEAMEVQISRLLGSAAKGKEAMSWISDFAAKTPFDIAQVTDAFVLAKQRGIDPMAGALRIMGDAAAGSRKDLSQAIEAIADAQTGEMERLKEFGITASSKGNNVVFKYIDREGKEASRSVRKSSTEIQGAVLGIWDSLHGGGMESQSKTFLGTISNIGDAWTRFELMVAKAGIFDNVKAKAEGLLGTLGKMSDDGRLEAWAKRISAGMEEMLNKASAFIYNTDWGYVAGQIGTVAGAAWKLVEAMAAVVNTADRMDREITRAEDWATANLHGDPTVRAAAQKKYTQKYAVGTATKAQKNQILDRLSGPMRPVLKPGRKISSAPQQHEFTVKVQSVNGLKASARPTRMASNSSYSTKRGSAMAGSA
jgi:phage tail tape-measure protein